MESTKLNEILKKKFPGEETESMARLLSKASIKGKISYKEIKYLGGSAEDLLLAYEKRLLLPVRTSKVSRTLAWEDRILAPDLDPEEIYEMPNVIQYLVKRAEETGKWEPEHAVKMYLEKIGESKIEDILELYRRVSSDAFSKNSKISGESLKNFSDKLGLDANVIIAELKGGGIISPSLRNPKHKLRYEINPSLL